MGNPGPEIRKYTGKLVQDGKYLALRVILKEVVVHFHEAFQQFEEDIVGLGDAQKKKAKITVIPPKDNCFIGTFLTHVDKDQVYFARTMRAVASQATFNFRTRGLVL